MADFKIKYASYATITISPASLATSSTRTAGRESDAVDNTSNLYLDALVSGFITVGTSPTGGQIDISVYAQHDDGPTYPDTIDGTDSAETITSENLRNAALMRAVSIASDTTSDRKYWIAPFSVAQLFGGVMPKRWGLFIAHNTGVNLNSTAGNHEFKYQGITHQSV